MDFLDTIFSFIPMVMIILFITRIAKSAGKKKRPKPLNTISKSDRKTEKSKPARTADKKKAAFDRAAFAHKPVQDKPAAPAPAVEVKPAPAAPVPKQVETAAAKKAEPQYSLIQNVQPEMTYKKKTIKKLNSLPELKKAVVWAEILGPPKGLQ